MKLEEVCSPDTCSSHDKVVDRQDGNVDTVSANIHPASSERRPDSERRTERCDDRKELRSELYWLQCSLEEWSISIQ